jgi:vitamin B12 transporter
MKNLYSVPRVRAMAGRARLTSIALVSLAAGGALAQATLKETVVTASRTEQAVQDALPSTTLITRADIERAQTPDLPTLLRRVAGIEITQNGGQGTLASAFIRGAESRHTLVLVDGVPVNNLNFGLPSLEHLPLANVERIEVVRGNVSALYGSAALGGVIQIFTREGAGAPQASASLQAGSRGLLQASAGGSVKLDSGTRLSANVESLGDKGFNALNQTQVPGTNPDRDGYTRRALSAGVSQDVGPGSVNLRLRDARGTTQYDSAFGPATQADESKYTETGAVLDGKFRLAPALDLQAALTTSADKLDARVTAFPYFVNSRSNGASLGLQWKPAAGKTVTAGLESTRQRIESNTVYKSASRTQNSLRLGYSGFYGAQGQHQV